MDKITARLIYPAEFELEYKDITLSELDFNVLTKCNKIGSEGKYFTVEEMYLEEKSYGVSLTLMLI